MNTNPNNDTGATRKFSTADLNNTDLTPKKKPLIPHTAKCKSGKARRIPSLLLNIFLTILLIGVITGIIVVSAFAIYIKNYLVEDYDIVGLENTLDQTTKIYYTDENGKEVELEDQRLHGSENRSWVSIGEMPKNLTNAFVAIEDQRFYEHNGMDLKRTAGAVLEFLKGNSSYGGSTITQQLIKNCSGENEATMQRKIKEIFRAISITKKHSKDEILEMYLNTISLSNGCYGVQAASNYLFGKDVSELSLTECASLAAIPKSPYKYNPKSHPEYNEERRTTVLDKMEELGMISSEECATAKSEELVLNITADAGESTAENVTSYFTDALIEQIITDLNEAYGYPRKVALNIIYSGGLEIHTTIDPKIQSIMEEVYADPDTFVQTEGIQPESAMVILDPYTGDVKGIVGGRGEKTGSRILNRATMSKRQVGSSIKPLTVYAPAIDLGYIDYATVMDDTPYKYMEDRESYWPANAGRDYRGLTTVNYALYQSLNTLAVKTLDKITPEYSYYFAKEKLGLESLVASDCDYAPLALGGLTNGLTVMEMAGAYTVFPNGGTHSSPRLYTVIYDNEGKILLENEIEQNIALSKSTAQIMTKILQNVVTQGTGTAVTLRKKIDVAGKTGSTNEDKDLYFVGYTPYYVGACWFGYDQPKYLGKRFGNNPALTAWDKVMTRVHEEIIGNAAAGAGSLKTFDDSELVKAKYCVDSGKVPTELCSDFDPRGSRVEEGWFKKGSEPKEECTTHVVVEFCKDSGGVANAYCPEESRVSYALVLAEDREYTENLLILDSQYTARILPSGVDPVCDGVSAYYAGLLPEGTFAGHSKTETPFNTGCTLHNTETAATDRDLENEDEHEPGPSDIYDPFLPDIDDPFDENDDIPPAPNGNEEDKKRQDNWESVPA